jgi:hypothetical protein
MIEEKELEKVFSLDHALVMSLPRKKEVPKCYPEEAIQDMGPTEE